MAEARRESVFERYAWTLVVANGVLWAILGIFSIISPHVAMSGSGYPPAAMTDLTGYTRVVGFFWLTGAPLQIGVAVTALRRHEKWAWFASLASVPVWALLNSYADAHWGVSVAGTVVEYFIFGGLTFVGLLLSIRPTFSTR